MIYVIQSGTGKEAPVKIGKTTAQRKGKRKKELQIGNPEKLYVIAKLRGGKKREAELHERFARSRIHGEWFHRTPEIDEWLDEIGASLPSHALAARALEDLEQIAGIPMPARIAAAVIVFFLVYLLLT